MQSGPTPTSPASPEDASSPRQALTARGEALRKLADASQPLYATLDADQKRRAVMLARPMRGPGWHRHHGRHGGEE